MFSSSPPGVVLEPFDVPSPQAHQILVRNSCTQVSAGSESNFLRFGPKAYGLPDGGHLSRNPGALIELLVVIAIVIATLGFAPAANARVHIHVDLSTQTMHVNSAQGSYSWPVSTARAGSRP